MRHGSLFSGIGGFDLAAQWCGWQNIFQVEIDDFCQKVLAKNFPDVKRYKDIKEFNGTEYNGTIDIISGGFPCQPFSVAGKRKGKADDRWLWDEMLRVIKEIQPCWIVGENVANLWNMGIENMLSQVENEGYEVESFIIPACAVNAPHKRDRVWIVAHSNVRRCGDVKKEYGEVVPNKIRKFSTEEQSGDFQQCWAGQSDCHAPNSQIEHDRGYIGNQETRQVQQSGNCFESKTIANAQGEPCASEQPGMFTRSWEGESGRSFSGCTASNSDPTRLAKRKSQPKNNEKKFQTTIREHWSENWLEVATRLCRVDDGLSRQMDRTNRLKALGNAIVPQIAYEIFNAIDKIEQSKLTLF